MATRRIGMGLTMGLEEQLPAGIALSTVEGLAGYMRKSSLWPVTFGLACCAIEMMAAGGGRYDLARFGMEVFRPSSRFDDRCGSRIAEDGSCCSPNLRSNAWTEVGALNGRMRLIWWNV